MNATLALGLSIAAACVPFAFALIRALAARDVRYFWVAIAGLVGAGLSTSIARTRNLGSFAAVAAAVATFVISTLFAVAAAVVIGTRLGPGLLVVGAAFGLCFAAAGFLHLIVRPHDGM